MRNYEATPLDYELIDFGRGRKLERFGRAVTDRPSVAAGDQRPSLPPSDWRELADLRFAGSSWEAGSDIGRDALEAGWTMDCGGAGHWTARLRPTAAGQVGCFPEHYPGFERVSALTATVGGDVPLALNLFAHTGLGSIQLAARGWSVTHVDSSRPAVRWAKQNAEGASDACTGPIRFIVDDAAEFAAREVRRGRRYHLICLDPPSYGHGGRGAWRIERDLDPLLDILGDLLHPAAAAIMLCGHSEPTLLRSVLSAPAAGELGRRLARPEVIDVTVADRRGRKLNSGYRVIWSAEPKIRSGTAYSFVYTGGRRRGRNVPPVSVFDPGRPSRRTRRPCRPLPPRLICPRAPLRTRPS